MQSVNNLCYMLYINFTRLRHAPLFSLPRRPSDGTAKPKAPIRPAKRKRGSRKRRPLNKHPFFDNRGFDTPQDDFESILPEASGRSVRRRQFPPRSISDVDPDFNVQFDQALHGEQIEKELLSRITHLPQHQQRAIRGIVEEFWCLFDRKGLLMPIKDYLCEIDTGNHRPIAVKNPTYGPLETPIVEKAINQLVELNMARQVFDGSWLSKGLLAAKPHQENVTDIEDFVWRFCVNYIALNAITKVIAMPIPRCNDAVDICFGGSMFRWLFDCPQGFNQIGVHPNSRHKLAFAGPNGTKYEYLVMPFGIVNGPVIFIIMMGDLNQTWQELGKARGIIFDSRTGTRIIIDDIFSWAPTFEIAMQYIRCQFEVCRSMNVSLSLKKSLFFPQRSEFVGIDVCDDGNRPAQTKFQLLKTWPAFISVRCIASFVGLINF
jgi:hypothetical protein